MVDMEQGEANVYPEENAVGLLLIFNCYWWPVGRLLGKDLPVEQFRTAGIWPGRYVTVKLNRVKKRAQRS